MARRAQTLAALLSQVNAAFPDRDKASDGWIGDEAHTSRTSDHNPRDGVVHAQDFDEGDDQRVGRALWAWLMDVRPPWVKYVIYEGRIVSSYPSSRGEPWTPGPYSGVNQHDHHLHVSVIDDRPFTGPAFGAQSEEDEMTEDDRKLLADIRGLAARAADRATLAADKATKTNAAVGRMERVHGAGLERLSSDGRPDPAALADEIVDALPPDLAQQVADEIANRLSN